MPDSFVTASRDIPLATLVKVTVTPGRMAPLASRMAPDTAAGSNWADTGVAHSHVVQARTRTRSFLMSPPARWNDEREARGDYARGRHSASGTTGATLLPEWVIHGERRAVTICPMLTDT